MFTVFEIYVDWLGFWVVFTHATISSKISSKGGLPIDVKQGTTSCRLNSESFDFVGADVEQLA